MKFFSAGKGRLGFSIHPASASQQRDLEVRSSNKTFRVKKIDAAASAAVATYHKL